MSLTITRRVQFNAGAKGRKRIEPAAPKPDVPSGRVPRISRLMALAIEMDRLPATTPSWRGSGTSAGRGSRRS